MWFSKNLKYIIEKRGLNLTTISKATNIPVSTLSEWTAGRVPKVSDSLIRLCQFLGLTLDELIVSEEFKNKEAKVFKSYIKIDGHEYLVTFKQINKRRIS